MARPGAQRGTNTSTAARIAAPLALLVALLALVIVATGSDEDSGPVDETVQQAADGQGGSDEDGEGRQVDDGGGGGGGGGEGRRRYTVEPGDTLSGIGDRFDLSEQEILELNPEIDPQALSPGEELKLR